MTFPTIPTVAATRVLVLNQANTTATRTFPAFSGLTMAAGDLLIAIVVGYRSSTTNAQFTGWTNGFTEFHDSGTSTTEAIGIAYKWTTGTETGSLAVTQATTVTGYASMILLSIPGAHATTPPEAGSRADGTTAAADPASFDPTGWAAEDTLWIAVGGSGETALTATYVGFSGTAPTNYTDYAATALVDDVIGRTQAAVAFRQVNASAEDVGVWAVDLSAASNSALIIAIRPAPATPVDSPALELSSFGTFTGVGSGDTINHVTVALTHHETSGALAPTYELWDAATAQIGTTQTGTTGTGDHTDTADFTGVTYSQLATLRVRVYGHATTTLVESVDSVTLTVNYTAVGGGGDFTGTAIIPVTATTTAAGTVEKVTGATLSAAAAIVAAGVVAVSGSATVPVTSTITAAGSVSGGGLTGSATVPVTATTTAAGAVGTATGASVPVTATITATGVVNRSTGATLVVTATTTAAGPVGTSTGATVPVTATIAAAGSVVSGLSGSATLPATATITATGVVAKSTGATSLVTATITAAGTASSPAYTGTATVLVTATTTAAGVVGRSTGATVPTTATITAAGTMAATGTAARSVTVTITAAGAVVGANDGVPVRNPGTVLTLPVSGTTLTLPQSGTTLTMPATRTELT